VVYTASYRKLKKPGRSFEMAGGLDPNLRLPEIIETPFIIPLPQLSAIEFGSFTVDRTEPKPAHLDFIKGVYVPFLIKQIELSKTPGWTN
jgi:hypothetical protein